MDMVRLSSDNLIQKLKKDENRSGLGGYEVVGGEGDFSGGC